MDQNPYAWCDAFPEAFEATIERAADRDVRFATLPPAIPMRSDLAAVQRAIALARQAGLQFPEPHVRWTFASGRARGQFEWPRGGAATVTFNTAECKTSDDVFCVALHEVAHLADVKSGVYERQSTAESERRAMRFATALMKGDARAAMVAMAINRRDDEPDQTNAPGAATRRNPHTAPSTLAASLIPIDLPRLHMRAMVNSVDQAARTVGVAFATATPVERIDGPTGTRYLEVLSMNAAHVRLDRLNSGAPVLNSHSVWSIEDVIGVVEQGSARIENGRGLATLRFSRREQVGEIWNDVVDGIIRSVSVGYRVHKMQAATPKTGDTLQTRIAIDWEPFEVSLVSIPADPSAGVRGA